MSGPQIGYNPLGAVDRAFLEARLGSLYDEEQRVYPLGFIDQGDGTVIIRFRASRACQYVRVHLQNTVVGGGIQGLFARGFGRIQTTGLYARGIGVGASGGGLAYNPNESVSSTQVDCRAARQQDVTVTRDGSTQHVVFLVPEFLEEDGSFTRMDGNDGDDHVAWIDIGSTA